MTAKQRELAIRLKLANIEKVVESECKDEVRHYLCDYIDHDEDVYIDSTPINLHDIKPREGLTLETELLIYEVARMFPKYNWIAWSVSIVCRIFENDPFIMQNQVWANKSLGVCIPGLEFKFTGDWKDSKINLNEYR